MSTDSAELKSTALSDLHVSLGAKMVPFAGFNMPVLYTNLIQEHHTVRNDVGVFDVSHMGEFYVEGPKAYDLVEYVTSNDVSTLTDGRVQYSCLPNETGGIIDDLPGFPNTTKNLAPPSATTAMPTACLLFRVQKQQPHCKNLHP
jgi:glycine cleavage system aminomethyltransferase T